MPPAKFACACNPGKLVQYINRKDGSLFCQDCYPKHQKDHDSLFFIDEGQIEKTVGEVLHRFIKATD